MNLQPFFITHHNVTALLGFMICLSHCILVTDSQQSSPVIVRESDTARFSWQIPAGESFVNIFVVSPSGSTVLLANAASLIQTGSNYTSRVTYTGDLSVRNMTFDLRDVVRSDAGTYTCGRNTPNDVIDDCGQKLIMLGLPMKPNLKGQSTPVLGSQMTLTCSSTSTTLPADHGLTLTYTWQGDNSDITVTSPGLSYTFTVTSRDTHRYRCRATESQGLQSQWSSEYLLQPEYLPYNVSLQPLTRSYTKIENEESVPSITCSAGCRPGCTYSWNKNGSVFTSGATLNLGLANRRQTGSYQCRATNKHGTEQGQNVTVDIKYAASITSLTINSMSDTVTVSEQDTVTLRCLVDGKPTSTVRLLNGTQELKRNHSLSVQHSWEVNCRQRGDYSCTANNNIGTAVTKTVKLAVKCFPRADRIQQFRFSAKRGGNVTLWVSVMAYPTPSYSWNRTNSSSQDLSGSIEHVSDISSNISLTLKNLQQQDFGQYNLIVENGIQTPVLFSVNVVPEGPPETPTDVTVTAESSTSLSVSWRRGFNGGAHQTFTVVYTQDNITLHRTDRVEETSDKEYYSLIVSNLHSSTEYFLKVYSENKFGNSTYTELLSGVTEMKIEVPQSNAALIAGVIVGILAVAILIGVLGFIFWRKRGSRAQKDESNGLRNLHEDTLVQPNVAHGSGEPTVDEYASVVKKMKSPSQAKPTDVYAKVDIKNKNKNERRKKKHGGAKYDQQGTEGNPYMNHGFDQGNNSSVQGQKGPPAGRDKNGCKYIDVEIVDSKPQMRPPKADSAPILYSSIQIGVVGPQMVEEDED